MPLNEKRLTHEAATAETHLFALCITSAFNSLVCVDKPTPGELAEIDAAKSACKKASKALADYQARLSVSLSPDPYPVSRGLGVAVHA